MAFDFSHAEMKAGHTIPITLDMLPGSPVVHLEHLGPENRTWIAAQIAAATGTAKTRAPAKTVADFERSYAETVEEQRAELATHAVRRLDATHTDTGQLATEADIPAFVAALPRDLVVRLHRIASSIEPFRRPAGDPKTIAGKS